MKKILACLIGILLFSGIAFAAVNYCETSGSKAAAAVIRAGESKLCAIIVTTDGTNAVTLDIYDNATAASGTKLIPTMVIPSSATDRIRQIIFNQPILARNGIYVNSSVAGGGSYAYVVYYQN